MESILTNSSSIAMGVSLLGMAGYCFDYLKNKLWEMSLKAPIDFPAEYFHKDEELRKDFKAAGQNEKEIASSIRKVYRDIAAQKAKYELISSGKYTLPELERSIAGGRKNWGTPIMNDFSDLKEEILKEHRPDIWKKIYTRSNFSMDMSGLVPTKDQFKDADLLQLVAA